MNTTRIEIHLSIGAPTERVFEALTRSEDLTAWFCEHADVSLDEKRYDFWGRFTPEKPPREGGDHLILEAVPNERLAYRWPLRGLDSRVEIDLAPENGGTRLTLRHENAPARRREDGAFADWWGGALENLKAWVERGAVGARVDFAARRETPLRLVTDVEAPRERVFQALVDPSLLDRTIAGPDPAVVEPREGGRYDLGWGEEGGPIRISTIRPPETLAYTWSFENEPETLVTWSLEESGGHTRLVLTHRGFPDGALDTPYRTGWTKFLNRVKHLVESGMSWRGATTTANDYAETV